MDTQRLFLLVIFLTSGFFLFQAWEREHRPPLPPAPTATAPAKPGEKAAETAGVPAPATTAAPPTATAPVAGQTIAIRTIRASRTCCCNGRPSARSSRSRD